MAAPSHGDGSPTTCQDGDLRAGMVIKGVLKWHLFFSLSPVGIVGGMIEAAVVAVVIANPFAWEYNKVAE